MTTLDAFVRRWGSAAPFLIKNGAFDLHRYAGDDVYAEIMRAEFAQIKNFGRTKKARRAPRFTHEMRLGQPNLKYWTVDENDILNAVYAPSGEPEQGKVLEKFSWNPVTGEFLLVTPGQQHASLDGKAPFDDYVRGIILHSRKEVTFRPFWPTWQQNDRYSSFDEDASEVSFDAQFACQEMLEHHGARGWSFQMNITNVKLEELTGTYRSRW